jgi:hypothetical protein
MFRFDSIGNNGSLLGVWRQPVPVVKHGAEPGNEEKLTLLTIFDSLEDSSCKIEW